MKLKLFRDIILIMMLIVGSACADKGFEGTITTKETVYMTDAQRPTAAEIQTIKNDIVKLKQDLTRAKGDDRAWLQEELNAAEATLAIAETQDINSVVKIYIKGTQIKAVEESDSNIETIFRGDALLTVNHQEKAYTEMGLAEMQQQLKALRDQFNQDGQSTGATPKKSELLTVEHPGQSQLILGHKCELILARRGAQVIELWVTNDYGNLVRQFMDATESITKPFTEMDGAETDLLSQLLKQITGMPLRTVEKENGKVVRQSEVQKIEEKSLSNKEFLPPAGYRKVSQPELPLMPK